MLIVDLFAVGLRMREGFFRLRMILTALVTIVHSSIGQYYWFIFTVLIHLLAVTILQILLFDIDYVKSIVL